MLSLFSKSYYLSPLYILSGLIKRLGVVLIILLATMSGVFYPSQAFPQAPRIVSAAVLSKNTTQEASSYKQSSVHKEHTSQVMLVAIGQEKIQPTPTVAPATQSSPANDWGVAHQIDEHTWTMNIGVDERMATAQEIFSALNVYRVKQGKQPLSWDDGLASFASSRAQTFTSLGTTDKHEGFTDYINNKDGFGKLGFNSLGENSSFGYKLFGVHIIEWVYASDAPHNDNQLSSSWSHVGIGVNNVSTDLVFGGSKR